MEQVRAATELEVDRLVELTESFLSVSGGRRGGALVLPTDDGGHPPAALRGPVAEYVTDPGRTALVGLLDEWVAGAALCRTDGSDGDRRGVLDVCFVEPGAREVGLGQLLLERSIEWFRGQGCSGVDGSAFPGDREEKNFFESSGFKARLLVMHRPLD